MSLKKELQQIMLRQIQETSLSSSLNQTLKRWKQLLQRSLPYIKSISWPNNDRFTFTLHLPTLASIITLRDTILNGTNTILLKKRRNFLSPLGVFKFSVFFIMAANCWQILCFLKRLCSKRMGSLMSG